MSADGQVGIIMMGYMDDLLSLSVSRVRHFLQWGLIILYCTPRSRESADDYSFTGC